MAKAYTKEEVIEASLIRFESLGKDYHERLRPMYEKFYDEHGKNKFRTYASVTPDSMKEYFERKKANVR